MRIIISTRVEKVAMTRIYAGILTFLGMKFLSIEIIALLQTSTNIVASPIDKPLTAAVVTASVGHVPSTSLKVALFLNTPLVSGSNVSKNFCLFIGTSLEIVIGGDGAFDGSKDGVGGVGGAGDLFRGESGGEVRNP